MSFQLQCELVNPGRGHAIDGSGPRHGAAITIYRRQPYVCPAAGRWSPRRACSSAMSTPIDTVSLTAPPRRPDLAPVCLPPQAVSRGGAPPAEPGFISDLKAGDLLGRSNEELVLLLIQLRRQAAAAAAARDRVSRQLDRAVTTDLT